MKEEKICKLAESHLLGEKIGKKTGQMYFIAVKGAEEVKIKKSYCKINLTFLIF